MVSCSTRTPRYSRSERCRGCSPSVKCTSRATRGCRGWRPLSALESASQIDVSHNAALEQLDIGRLGSIDYYLRVTHNPLLDSASVTRPAGGTVIVGGNLGEAIGLDPCPWSGNSFCESAPVDDLCAPGSDSDCPSGEPL